MRLFFADDSKQNKPSRPGMGQLVAVGGISVHSEAIHSLEKGINNICNKFGFPKETEFKWSPPQNNWMRRHLVHESRFEFYQSIFTLVKEQEVTAIVIIEDTNYRTATREATSPFMDATKLLLERVNQHFERNQTSGIIITDKPGGGNNDEEKYLEQCLETLLGGTDYVNFNHIVLNVLTAHSHFSRLLQLADVITSCTLARIAGEETYSPQVFDLIKDLFDNKRGKIGGYGIKIHPDFKYKQLYGELLGDNIFVPPPFLPEFPDE